MILLKNSTSGASFSYDEEGRTPLRVTVKPAAASQNFDTITYNCDGVKPIRRSHDAREKVGRAVPRFRGRESRLHPQEHSQKKKPACAASGGISAGPGYDESRDTGCLDNKLTPGEEALKVEDTSIQNEDRFENWRKRSQILDAWARKSEPQRPAPR